VAFLLGLALFAKVLVQIQRCRARQRFGEQRNESSVPPRGKEDDGSFDNSFGMSEIASIRAPPPAYVPPPDYHGDVPHDVEKGYGRSLWCVVSLSLHLLLFLSRVDFGLFETLR